MDSIPPTLPFHLAKAYGVKASAAPGAGFPRPAGLTSAAPASGITVRPVGSGVDAVVGTRAAEIAKAATSAPDTAELASATKIASLKERLVAAIVPGGVSFAGATARPTATTGLSAPASPPATVVSETPRADAIPFYRHPADKNAAATAINLGARLDTRG